MRHRRENKYLRPPVGYTPPTDPNQQAIRPPIGGITPLNNVMVPPPIVNAPPPGYLSYEIKPPIGVFQCNPRLHRQLELNLQR